MIARIIRFHIKFVKTLINDDLTSPGNIDVYFQPLIAELVLAGD